MVSFDFLAAIEKRISVLCQLRKNGHQNVAALNQSKPDSKSEPADLSTILIEIQKVQALLAGIESRLAILEDFKRQLALDGVIRCKNPECGRAIEPERLIATNFEAKVCFACAQEEGREGKTQRTRRRG